MTQNRVTGYGVGSPQEVLAPVPFETNRTLGTADYQYNIGQLAYEIPNSRWVLYTGNGIWIPVINGDANVSYLAGNSGGNVPPTAAGILNVVGDGTTINIVGDVSTNTLTASLIGTGATETLTGNSGGAISPTAGNINTVGTGSVTIVGSGSTLTTQLTGLTDHAILVGAGTTTITKVGPSATSGQVLQSAGSSTDPAFSTATYPATTTANQILYSSSTNVVAGLSTVDNGVLITGTTGIPSILADGTTGQVLTATTGGPPSWTSIAEGYSAAAITVSPTAGQGNYTTIGAALAAASSGQTILIKEGTYTEDPALVAGVTLAAWQGMTFQPNVIINGKCTFSGAGTVTISGIAFQTNSDYFLAVTGSATSIVNLINCNLNCLNNTGIDFTSSSGGSSISMTNCVGNIATTGISLYTMSSSGAINITNTNIYNTGGATTASTSSAGFVSIDYSGVYFPISTSSTSVLTGQSSDFINTQPAICITTAGSSSSNVFYGCLFISNADSCVSIGSGTTVVMADCQLQSSNTNVITGAGTLLAALLTFVGTSSGINTSTVTGLITYGGGVSGAARAWGTIAASGGGATLTKGFNIASVTNTANAVVTFTTAMSDANYALVSGSSAAVGSVGYSITSVSANGFTVTGIGTQTFWFAVFD